MEHFEGVEGEEKNKKEEEGFIVDAKKEKKFLDTRLVALFIIGALVGITLKTHAIQSITMGFEDYKLQNLKSDFGLSPEKDEVVEAEDVSQSIEEAGNEDIEAGDVIIEEETSENQE